MAKLFHKVAVKAQNVSVPPKVTARAAGHIIYTKAQQVTLLVLWPFFLASLTIYQRRFGKQTKVTWYYKKSLVYLNPCPHPN